MICLMLCEVSIVVSMLVFVLMLNVSDVVGSGVCVMSLMYLLCIGENML